VLAVDPDLAEGAGWPASQPTWSSMIQAPIAQWRLGLPDPQTATAGLAALVAVRQQSAAFSTLGRRLELPTTTERSPARIVADGDLDAMPTAEYDVARVAGAGGEVVASYDAQLGGTLDFPLIGITPDDAAVTDQVAADLALLMEALRDPATQALLAATGLRTLDGDLAEKYAGEDGTPTLGVLAGQTSEPFQAGPAKVAKTLLSWSSVGRRSRLLILLDVSGSMAETLATGERAKIDLARRSLRELVDASAPDSDLGLWTFTTGEASDGTDRVVDVGPLGEELDEGQSRRELLTEVVDELTPVPDGGTPLYRAVLAAYASALDDYAFGRYNALVVVTDGRDADDTQAPIPAAEVIDQLRRQYDGMRSVEIISLAYGEDVDFDVLQRMADVTGGAAYQGLTQNQVSKMLSDALAPS
jgi:Ca-activated chloride channel homolog